MRIVFMGAPEFAVPALRRIVNSGRRVVAVYTRAPKPGGRRGLQLSKTPVHVTADSLGLPVFTPSTLRTEEAQETFRSHGADVGLVTAYGLLLPQRILAAPAFGCLNLHASLLPRWRGAAPIHRAIMAGDHETGVDLMQMEAGLDTGPIALREVVPIGPEDTAGDLTIRLAQTAAHLAVRALSDMESGVLIFNAQAATGVCYAHKIDKAETEIDWRQDANAVRNHIHGLSPMPGAFSTLVIRGAVERIKILRAETAPNDGTPGKILDEAMTVACGTGAIRIREVQQAGRTTVSGRELMRRTDVAVGATFMQSEPTSAES
jgi:methionyl-tRNA formyltransferase